MPERPLLIIDGDSFAHRAYHGLPKSIRRAGNREIARIRPAEVRERYRRRGSSFCR